MKKIKNKSIHITVPSFIVGVLATVILIVGCIIIGYALYPIAHSYKNSPQYPDSQIHILENEFYHNNQTDVNSLPSLKKYVESYIAIQNNIPSALPCVGPNISSFGWRSSPFGHWRDYHQGVDLVAPLGAPIKATAPGTVMFSGWHGGYGIMILIKHKYGFETIYAHCSYSIVAIGQSVGKDQIIGYVGRTGNVTGTHCHYEVRLSIPIDPTDVGAVFR
jgi:murein DD-endopeptidase MepM/ murein hydrolase activator NlpD